MKEDYRNAMNKIKADDEFKARLLTALEAEKNTPKPKRDMTLVFKRYAPLVSGIAAALVLTLAVFASRTYILPLLKHDVEIAKTDKNPVGDNFDIVKDDQLKSETTVTTHNIPNTNSNSDVSDSSTVPDADDAAQPAPLPDTSYTEANAMDATDTTEQQYRISYSTNEVAIKGLSTASKTINYDLVLHFTFEGFDEYGVSLVQNDIIFCKELPSEYTIADLFTDHYNIIIGDMGNIALYNGLLDTFMDIQASEEKPIDVYINGIEILNLETAFMNEFKYSTDVYFVISAT